MKINSEIIRSFNPCNEGINNFEKHYSDFNGTLTELLLLENIPYSDKIWLVTKMVDYKILQRWSLACAKSVVHIYKKEFPNDNVLDEVLDTVEKVLDGELDELVAESAARSAESAAWSAWSARSAESAAWSARSAESAARLAARSAESAARLAARSAESESIQEELNIKLLIELLKGE